MLFLYAVAENISTKFSRNCEFIVTGSFPVKNSPVLVHDRIYHGVTGTAVLRLHVENLVVNEYVRVKSGTHRLPIPSRSAQRSAAAN